MTAGRETVGGCETVGGAGTVRVPGEVRVPEGTDLLSTSPRVAVYPGSFDPVTLGHLNVMERASRLFDRLVVGIGVNSEKTPMFSVSQRMDLIRLSTTHLPNVEVQSFDGLAVNFVRGCGARVMIRGVRPITDIPAEITMMMANRRLAPDVETLFMIADGELAHVSSSLIKEIYRLADEESLCRFLPLPVTRAIHERLRMGE